MLRADTPDDQALSGVPIGAPANRGTDGGSDLWGLESAVTALAGLDTAFGAIDACIDAATGVS